MPDQFVAVKIIPGDASVEMLTEVMVALNQLFVLCDEPELEFSNAITEGGEQFIKGVIR